jgi:hypothetical protein
MNNDDKIKELKIQTEKEMKAKNDLYFFLAGQEAGRRELRKFELSHDMSSADCHAIDTDPLRKAQKDYELERNIKNNLLAFINKLGLKEKLEANFKNL